MGLTGAFGGSLELDEAQATESVSPELAGQLAVNGAAPAHPALVPIFGLPPRAALVYHGDLRGLAPLGPGDLAPLEAVLDGLAALHARGRAHGDLRPEHVWTGARTVLTYPERGVDAPALLASRLRGGASPATVGFVAPEVVAGGAATPASDVYAFAALVHFRVTGRVPHGTPRLGELPRELRRVVRRGLGDAAARPGLEELRGALARAASLAASTSTSTGASTDAGAAPRVTMVAPGELLAAARADASAPHLGPLPSGERERAEASAPLPSGESPPTPSAPRVRLISTPEGVPAAKAEKERRDTPVILNLLLLLGGTFTLVGAFWLVVRGFQTLGERGPFALLATLTAGIGVAGQLLERRSYPRSGFALIVLATQLLWAVGAYFLLLSENLAPAPWAVVAGIVGGVTFATAIWKRSALLSVLGLAGVAGALLLLGHVLRTGKPEGAAVWTLLCGSVVAALASVAHRTAGDRVALPPALGAVLFAVASTGAALATWRELPAFSVGWPYLVGALSGGVALALRGPERAGYRACALAALLPALVATPVFHAFAKPGAPPAYGLAATLAGAALVGAALTRRLEARPAAASLASVVGLAHVAASRSWTVFTGVLATATFGLAIRHRSGPLAFVGSVLAATSLVLANRAWASEEVPHAALWAAVVAVALGGLAVLGARRAGDAVAGPPFALALIATLASAGLALDGVLLPPGRFALAPVTFAIAWPYALAAALGVAAALARGSFRGAVLVTLLVVLGATPIFHAFAHASAPPVYGRAVATAGAVVGALALLWPRVAAHAGLQAVLVAVAVAHVAAARESALTWGALALGCYGLALRHEAPGLSLAAGASASVATWLLGRPFWESKPEAPAELALALAAAQAAGAAIAHRRAGGATAGPLVVLAVLAHAASLLLALLTARLEGMTGFAVGWPYGLAGVATLAALVLHGRNAPVPRDAAVVAAALALGVTPLFHAFARELDAGVVPADLAGYRHAAAIGGALLIAASFSLPGVRASGLHQGAFLLVGVANVAAERSPTALLAALAAATYGLAARTGGAVLGVLSAALAGGALLELGAELHLEAAGQAQLALGGAVVLGAAAVASVFAAPGAAPVVARPYAAVAHVALVASALCAFQRARDPDGQLLAIGWPYLAAAFALGASLAVRARATADRAGALEHYARGSELTLALLLAGAPLAHAYANPHVPPVYLGACATLGAALVLLGTALPRLLGGDWTRGLVPVVGLANAQAARSPSLTTGVLAAAAFATAVAKRSSGLATLASLLAVASVALVGQEVWTTRPEGPALGCLAGAAVLAAMAALGRWRSASDAPALPPASFALLLLLGSAGAATALLLRPGLETFSVAWPYLLAALAGGVAAALRGDEVATYRNMATFGALAILLPTPLLHALVHRASPVHVYVASTVGTALLVAAFRWEPARRTQRLAIAAGLANVALPPGVLALVHLAPRDGDALLAGLLSGAPAPPGLVQHPLFYLSYLVVTSGVLVGLALLFAEDGDRRPYRALELSGLLLFFLVLSALSLIRFREYLYPSVLFAGGLALVATGAWRRHLLLVAVPVGFLIPMLWIQYFVKLWGHVQLGWLSIGFGIGILAGAILFERAVRPRLAELRAWR